MRKTRLRFSGSQLRTFTGAIFLRHWQWGCEVGPTTSGVVRSILNYVFEHIYSQETPQEYSENFREKERPMKTYRAHGTKGLSLFSILGPGHLIVFAPRLFPHDSPQVWSSWRLWRHSSPIRGPATRFGFEDVQKSGFREPHVRCETRFCWHSQQCFCWLPPFQGFLSRCSLVF